MIGPFMSAGSSEQAQHMDTSICEAALLLDFAGSNLFGFTLSHSVLKKKCSSSPAAESDEKTNCNARSQHVPTTEKVAAPELFFKPFVQASPQFAVPSSGIVTAHTY